MNLQDFNLLHDVEKDELLWDTGFFVTTVDYENVICDVYKVYDFYVSLTYQIGVTQGAQISASKSPKNLTTVSEIKKMFSKLGR